MVSELPQVSPGQWMAVGMTMLIVGPLLFAIGAYLVGKRESARNAGRFSLVAMLCTGILLLVVAMLGSENLYGIGFVLSLVGGIPLTFMKADPKNAKSR